MCSVSVISDYGAGINPGFWTQASLADFRRMLELAREFDEKTGQPDCEDPKKSEWIEVVKTKLDKGCSDAE